MKLGKNTVSFCKPRDTPTVASDEYVLYRSVCPCMFVIISFIVQRLGLFSARSPRSLPVSTAREEKKGGAPNQTRWSLQRQEPKGKKLMHETATMDGSGESAVLHSPVLTSPAKMRLGRSEAKRGHMHASVARSLIIIRLISIHYFNTWPGQVADNHIIRLQKLYSLPRR